LRQRSRSRTPPWQIVYHIGGVRYKAMGPENERTRERENERTRTTTEDTEGRGGTWRAEEERDENEHEETEAEGFTEDAMGWCETRNGFRAALYIAGGCGI